MLKSFFKGIHLTTAWFLNRPAVFLFLFIGWNVTLWLLSSGNPIPKNAPEIPHLDKIAHFGYFFIGGSLFAFYAYLRWEWCRSHRFLFLWMLTLLIMVIGWLDEYHQSFTPGRSGNDPWDWLADICGGAGGACFVLFVFLPRFIKLLPRR